MIFDSILMISNDPEKVLCCVYAPSIYKKKKRGKKLDRDAACSGSRFASTGGGTSFCGCFIAGAIDC